MTNLTNPNPSLELQLAAIAQKISVKASNVDDLQSLIFIILNDTFHVCPYDRAILWEMRSNRVEALGFSGQAVFSKHSEFMNHWKDLVKAIPNPTTAQELTSNSFPDLQKEWETVLQSNSSTVLWLPIATQKDHSIGLWLEKWKDPHWPLDYQTNIKVLKESLFPLYAGLWKKFDRGFSWKKVKEQSKKRHFRWLVYLALLSLLFIRIPLRIAAPCEVVSENIYVVTAPLDGIIEQVVVQSGQEVHKGKILYEYDKRVPEQTLLVAQKNVEVIQSEINRVIASSVQDDKALAEVAALNVKLKKAELDYEFAKQKASFLVGKAPVEGIAVIEKPEEWRGKPVKMGEKILSINDPSHTKVRIWVPEEDFIAINRDVPISVFLNPFPEKTFTARIDHLSQETTLSERKVISFIADANWEPPPPDVQLGVKGTAVLYGEKVSLFYYIFRKPILTLRRFFSI